eukprot:jgi/Mesvir1/16648/Mv10187-RA.1
MSLYMVNCKSSVLSLSDLAYDLNSDAFYADTCAIELESTGFPGNFLTCHLSLVGGLPTNPTCYFSAADIVLDSDTACPNAFAVDAVIHANVSDCDVTSYSLPAIVADLTAVPRPLYDIPVCAVEMTPIMTYVDDSPDDLDDDSSDEDSSDDRRRKLLSRRRELLMLVPPDAGRIALAMRVHVPTEARGLTLRDMLNSEEGRGLMAAILEAQVGIVTDVSVAATLVSLQASVKSDPHFSTPDGRTFDFQGVAGETYCVVTDKRVQVNTRLMGAAANVTLVARKSPLAGAASSQPDARTWMDQVGILYGGDRILIGAASLAGTPYPISVGTIHVNGVSAHV